MVLRCLGLQTAVVMVEDEELHLVAMRSGNDEKLVCFWCCSVPAGLYDSCLGLLNQRCLAIVFDLDETLIVANTMKSFEDRIEFLQRRIACETDLLRASGMKAELKRYLEDKALLKQYSENDQVTDSGKFVKAQIEEVPSFSNNQNRVLRPIIRFPEKNIVLTRINPEVAFCFLLYSCSDFLIDICIHCRLITHCVTAIYITCITHIVKTHWVEA